MPTGDLIHFIIGVIVGVLLVLAVQLSIAIWRDCPKPRTPLIKRGQGRE